MLYLFQLLKSADRIPDLPIYIDSPMACDATAVYREHHEDHDLSDGELDPEHPALGGRKVILARTAAESKAINRTAGPAVIIASSGMMTGGRIVHHLKQRMPDPRNTIIIGGYQAVGTRGRLIEEHAPFVRMFGQDVPLRARGRKNPRPQRPRRSQRPCSAGSANSRTPRSKRSSPTANPPRPMRWPKNSAPPAAGTSRRRRWARRFSSISGGEF